MTGETHILLAHGNGGRLMRELIDEVFLPHLANPYLNTRADAVAVPHEGGRIMLTADSFTVQPLEFPGGDIGTLAVHGTVNDLAVAGATPLYMTLALIIEEGFEISRLERIAMSIGRAARENGIAVVAGDTKVVRRGEGGGLYLATTGMGSCAPDRQLGMQEIQAEDRILVSGPIGDHGISVLLAREEFGLGGEVRSDCASVLGLARALLPLPGLRFMRDPTRGGLATVMNELCRATALGVTLHEMAIPIRPAVRSVCEMLGYDPLYLACEGRVVAVVARHDVEAALAAWRKLPEGSDAEVIGTVTAGRPYVSLHTVIGGERLLDELEDDPLPRIC